jgi:hypothetical protein
VGCGKGKDSGPWAVESQLAAAKASKSPTGGILAGAGGQSTGGGQAVTRQDQTKRSDSRRVPTTTDLFTC